jgi:hypothetical protein
MRNEKTSKSPIPNSCHQVCKHSPSFSHFGLHQIMWYIGLSWAPEHGRMARGGHGLPKVSRGLAMPDPSMPCGRATPGGRLMAVFYPIGQRWPMRANETHDDNSRKELKSVSEQKKIKDEFIAVFRNESRWNHGSITLISLFINENRWKSIINDPVTFYIFFSTPHIGLGQMG